MKAKVLCAWCSKFIRWIDTPEGYHSHTICDECIEKHGYGIKAAATPTDDKDDHPEVPQGV